MISKKFLFSTFLIFLIFVGAFIFSREKNIPSQEPVERAVSVSAMPAADSKYLIEKKTYPGNVVGEQEIALVARASGIVSSFPYEIGSPIKAGSLIARIDDTGNLSVGENGFQSNEIQQSELATEQAKKSYGLSKDVYEDKRDSDGVENIDKKTAKTQKEIAKIQYEAAKINLQASLNNHSVISPLTGFVISRNVSMGDYVSAGQVIATISRVASAKIQFYVNQDEVSDFQKNQPIRVTNNRQESFDVKIKNISPQADPETRRFLIEASPEKQDALKLLLGTIVSVSLEKKQLPSSDQNFILPLSALTLSQNENFVFIAKNGTAKKIPAQIIRIIGENAEIKAPIDNNDLIITKGNKMLDDGKAILINS